MNYTTKEKLIKDDMNSIENRVRHAFNQGYDLGFKDGKEKAKSQEPKTVLYSGDGYADGYMVYDMAECPNCGYEYEDGDKDWGLPFCPNCGQSLDWESEDAE